MRSSTTRATALVVALFMGGMLGGAWAGSAAAARAKDPYASVDTLVRVLGLIETTYVDEVPTEDLVSAAIDGMLDTLDPHSTWMSTHQWRDLQRETHGSYTGIGVEIRIEDGTPVVSKVLAGGPASREGFVEGDRILAVDGTDLEDADKEAISTALLGPRGSKTTIRVLREGWEAPKELSATRDEVRPPAVTVQRVNRTTVWARLQQFREGASAELRDALARADKDGLANLVLDLRDNTGGLLREAVAVGDLFLDDGVIVSTWGRVEGERKDYEATPGGLSPDVRVVVLVNGLSASASEVVAGALQDTGRATLVGERTYGKGSVQSIFEHRDGSALKLTIGRYYTPSGEPVAPRDGREPDVVVPWPTEVHAFDQLEARLQKDDVPEALRAELQALVDKAPKAHVKRHAKIPWDVSLPDRLDVDPQLAEAIRVLSERR